MLLEKKSSFFFIPFWPLLEQFRVLVFFFSLVFFLGTDQRREEDLNEEDEKKDKKGFAAVVGFRREQHDKGSLLRLFSRRSSKSFF